MEHATASRVLLLHFRGPKGRMVLGTFRDGHKKRFYVGQPFAHVQYQDSIGCPQETTDLLPCNHSEELAIAKSKLLSALTSAANGDERLLGLVDMAEKYVIDACFSVWMNAIFFGFDIAQQYVSTVEELCHLTWPSKDTLTHYYHQTSNVRDDPLPVRPATHHYPKVHVQKDPLPGMCATPYNGISHVRDDPLPVKPATHYYATSHVRDDPLPHALPVSAPHNHQPSSSRDKMAAEIVRQQYNDKMAMSLDEGYTDDGKFGPEVHKERQYEEEEKAPRDKDHDISDLELHDIDSMRMFPDLDEF